MAKTILIVEDDDLNMRLFNNLLQSHGFNTVQSDAVDLDILQLARERRPDLILMDIQLPETSGVEHTKALKNDNELKTIPVLAVSALAMVGDREKILAVGCDGYIPKPINIPHFLNEVKRFLTMERFRLTATLITGHAEVDAEHERLVVLMYEIADLLEAGDNNGMASKISEISKVLISHFENEERVMEKLGDKHLKTHENEHMAIVKRYRTLINCAEQDGYQSNFLDELKALLVEDMLETDTGFKEHLQEITYQD